MKVSRPWAKQKMLGNFAALNMHSKMEIIKNMPEKIRKLNLEDEADRKLEGLFFEKRH